MFFQQYVYPGKWDMMNIWWTQFDLNIYFFKWFGTNFGQQKTPTKLLLGSNLWSTRSTHRIHVTGILTLHLDDVCGKCRYIYTYNICNPIRTILPSMAESGTAWNVSNPVNIRGKLPLKWYRISSISSICIRIYIHTVCNLIPLLVPIDVVICFSSHLFDWFEEHLGMVPDGALVVSWPCKDANKNLSKNKTSKN